MVDGCLLKRDLALESIQRRKKELAAKDREIAIIEGKMKEVKDRLAVDKPKVRRSSKILYSNQKCQFLISYLINHVLIIHELKCYSDIKNRSCLF